jgi:hypothetical protein
MGPKLGISRLSGMREIHSKMFMVPVTKTWEGELADMISCLHMIGSFLLLIFQRGRLVSYVCIDLGKARSGFYGGFEAEIGGLVEHTHVGES